MDTELEKLVEASKLTPRAAQQLEKLKPGTFCLHKSWGFGRVNEWNLLLNQIVIDFAGKKSHPMQAQYAAAGARALPCTQSNRPGVDQKFGKGRSACPGAKYSRKFGR
jgi:hypothetical protein